MSRRQLMITDKLSGSFQGHGSEEVDRFKGSILNC